MTPDDMIDSEWNQIVEEASFELEMMLAELRLEERGGDDMSM